MRIGIIQMKVCAEKEKNLNKAIAEIEKIAEKGAELVILPEMFLCPYDNAHFGDYAEEAGGSAWRALSGAAKANHITLVGGSIPERDQGKLYNTSFIFDEQGNEVGRHRKLHLFDIDIEGGQRFMESETLTQGQKMTVIKKESLTFGVCICFDMRFPELIRAMTLQGAKLIIAPAAFNMTTGPMHWELMFRQRAVDNQVFTIGTAPARDESAGYISYGNSIVVSPWGKVLYRCGGEETTDLIDIDVEEVDQVRKQLPLLSARRTDLY